MKRKLIDHKENLVQLLLYWKKFPPWNIQGGNNTPNDGRHDKVDTKDNDRASDNRRSVHVNQTYPCDRAL